MKKACCNEIVDFGFYFFYGCKFGIEKKSGAPTEVPLCSYESCPLNKETKEG